MALPGHNELTSLVQGQIYNWFDCEYFVIVSILEFCADPSISPSAVWRWSLYISKRSLALIPPYLQVQSDPDPSISPSAVWRWSLYISKRSLASIPLYIPSAVWRWSLYISRTTVEWHICYVVFPVQVSGHAKAARCAGCGDRWPWRSASRRGGTLHVWLPQVQRPDLAYVGLRSQDADYAVLCPAAQFLQTYHWRGNKHLK